MARRALDIGKLGVEERLELIEELWDSLSDDPGQIPMPKSHKAVLDQRIDEMDAGDERGIPWDDVLDRIRDRIA